MKSSRLFLLSAIVGVAAISCARAQPPDERAAKSSADSVVVTRAFPSLKFSAPVDLQAMPGTNNLCVVEQNGRIALFNNQSSTTDTVRMLDITGRVRYGGEMGLLGLAFDPQFADNRTFYVFYVADNPLRNVVSRFKMLDGSVDRADTGSEEVLLSIHDPYENHNGGQIRFGADGYLYISTGDGGSGGDPENRAQNRDSLLGKMLRIDVHSADSGLAYAIPPGNPYVNSTAGYRKEIYTYGLRNAWRWSFDPHTPSNIWIADVGQDRWEEIDVVKGPGENLGWKVTEGHHCYRPSTGCDSSGMTMPVWEYEHGDGNVSITGGFVYRGVTAPPLVDRYVYADFSSGRIWSLRLLESGGADNVLVQDSPYNISAFGEDHAGELYFTSFDGRIYKFTTVTVSGVAGAVEGDRLQLRSIAPNPARDRATVSFVLDRPAEVEITLFDPLGRAVRTLQGGVMGAGERQLAVDLFGLPAGRLLLRLRAGDRAVTQPLDRE